MIDVNSCDLNEDYFHFTNVANVESILNTGLLPSVGIASKMVEDRPNVSLSQGGKGVMGIVNSFIYMFKVMKVNEIPNEFRKYFIDDINDFTMDELVGLDLACRAVARKLKDEVYFRVDIDESVIEKEARIGGFTGFDINLPVAIDKSNLQLVAREGEVITALDFAKFIYEKAKDFDIFREMNGDFFHMFEMDQTDLSLDSEETENAK